MNLATLFLSVCNAVRSIPMAITPYAPYYCTLNSRYAKLLIIDAPKSLLYFRRYRRDTDALVPSLLMLVFQDIRYSFCRVDLIRGNIECILADQARCYAKFAVYTCQAISLISLCSILNAPIPVWSVVIPGRCVCKPSNKRVWHHLPCTCSIRARNDIRIFWRCFEVRPVSPHTLSPPLKVFVALLPHVPTLNFEHRSILQGTRYQVGMCPAFLPVKYPRQLLPIERSPVVLYMKVPEACHIWIELP